MNVFPVERGDECLVEFGQDGMREFIALTFDAANLVDFFPDIVVVREKIDQGASSGNEIVRHCREHHEEAVIFGDKTDHFGRKSNLTLTYSPLR